MKTRKLMIIFAAFLHIQCAVCFIDPITFVIGSIAAGVLYAGYQKTFNDCTNYECCNENHLRVNVHDLQRRLATDLHGQHIVQPTVVSVMRGYKATNNPPKALAISFHGTPGTGKNFVAKMIAESFYKKGIHSEYYHFFSGSSFSKRHLESDMDNIRDTIAGSLLKCANSMFVFDEVDMMPEGLLDVLVPFLNYGETTKTLYKYQYVPVTINKAIFIFLSNRGSQQIIQQMLNFWTNGKSRESLTLKDFENLIAIGAFNEEGGFLKSKAIGASLIDYYVPFLPLEKNHVELCMKDAFMYRANPTTAMEDAVMSIVTYGPEPHNIYALSGCKRIEQKVISVSYGG